MKEAADDVKLSYKVSQLRFRHHREKNRESEREKKRGKSKKVKRGKALFDKLFPPFFSCPLPLHCTAKSQNYEPHYLDTVNIG